MTSDARVRPARLTVVVACFNHEKYVETCLQSVFSQVGADFDVVVCDDASTDGSQETISELLTVHGWEARTVFHEENRGICATFNEALALADSEYITYIAADDFMLEDRIARQIAFFDELSDEYAMVYGATQMVDADGNELATRFSDEQVVPEGRDFGGEETALELLRIKNWISAPSAISRVSALRAVHGYDENLWYEDFDMWLRLSRKYRFAFFDEPVVAYRKLVTSMSGDVRNASRFEINLVRIYAKHIDLDMQLEGMLSRRMYDVARVEHAHGRMSRREALRAMTPYVRRKPSVGAFGRLSLTFVGLGSLMRKR